MATSCTYASLLVLALFVSASLLPAVFAGDILQAACAKTPYPGVCLDTLLELPESRTADARTLAELAMSEAASVGAAAGTFARSELNHVKDSELWQCLDECADDIEEAVSHLDDSEGDVDDDKLNEVRLFLSTALSDSSSCEESCRDLPPAAVKDAILAKNAMFDKLMRITAALIIQASDETGSAPAPAPAPSI